MENNTTAADKRKSLFDYWIANDVKRVDFNLVLDAERRLAAAQLEHKRATVEHTLAIKNLNYQGGRLLEEYGICMSEQQWSGHYVAQTNTTLASPLPSYRLSDTCGPIEQPVRPVLAPDDGR